MNRTVKSHEIRYTRIGLEFKLNLSDPVPRYRILPYRYLPYLGTGT